MAWPAPSPGRPLEAEGDLRSRGMTVLDRIRAYRPARPRHPNGATGRIPDDPHKEDQDMRVFAGIAAAAILIAACGGPAAVSTPTPTASPTPTPTPIPTVADTFKADLKASNENPPITDAEASCSGTATVTLSTTSVKFDVTITGCPATTAINIGHIHEGAAGVAGPVKISTGLAAGDLTLPGGGVTFSKTATPAGPPAWDAALISAIMANPAGYYVNFHSTAHGGGVIRGQLTKA